MIARLDHRMVVKGLALAMVLCVLLVALVFALGPATTTSDREFNPTIHAISADGTGGSSLTHDPYIERHAEVVQRLGGGSLR
jgi:Trk-type K+ transport system membrane component